LRSRTFTCPGRFAAGRGPVITHSVPVIPGRYDIRHSRPTYEPVHGHYVNPPGGRRRQARRVAVGAVVGILLWAALVLILRFAAFSPTPVGTPGDWVTPEPIPAPPATTGAGR
jgi:hypothetical protein